MTGTPGPPAVDEPLNITELMRGGLARAPVTGALIAANLVVFAAMLTRGAGLWHSPNDVQLAWGASFGPAIKDGEWWRLGTAMFLHFGLLHLAVNLWALLDSGRLVERLFGSWRFFTLYALGGIAGNLLSLYVHGDHAVSGGASGAIFSAYGALLALLWRERRQVHPVEFRWLFWGAAAFSLAYIGLGVLVPGIDNAAHVGGLAAGALLGVALARPLTAANSRPGAGRWFAGGVLALAVVLLIMAIPEPSYRWADEARARTEIQHFLAEDRRLSERWRGILESGRADGTSFEELARRIESDVASEYRESFDQLSALNLDPAAPSAGTVETLARYSWLREEASRALAEGLLRHDEKLIHEALEAARRAAYAAKGSDAPPKRMRDAGKQAAPGRSSQKKDD